MQGLHELVWRGTRREQHARAATLWGSFDRTIALVSQDIAEGKCAIAAERYGSARGTLEELRETSVELLLPWPRRRMARWTSGRRVAEVDKAPARQARTWVREARRSAARTEAAVHQCFLDNRPWEAPQIVYADMDLEWPEGGGIPRRALLEF